MRRAARLTALWSVGLAVATGVPLLAAVPLTSGTFLVDEPTLNSLGFRWLVEGDDDLDATAQVAFRRQGETSWQASLSMLRIHTDPAGTDGWVTGNLFAGSVLNLAPSTTFDIRVTLSDPDGVTGGSEHLFTAATRALPADGDGAVWDVYPSCTGVDRPDPCFEDVVTAAAAAQPGDLILIHDGVYSESGPLDLTFLATLPTTEAEPISFRGEHRDLVIFDRGLPPDSQSPEPLFLLDNTRHLHFSRFTIRNAGHAFSAPDAEGLVVRGLRMEQVRIGVTGSDASTAAVDRNWYIADNDITGRNPAWFPRGNSALSISHTGIRVYGKGHVVAFNQVGRFWDCVAHANTGGGMVTNDQIDWREPPARNIDINNNELFECIDDGIEGDYGFHNFRLFNNRITNAHTALSVQPFYGGPIYLYRNVADNITANSFKFHNQPAGIEAYNNTLLIHDFSFESAAGWRNASLRNNLLMGFPDSTTRSMVTGTPPDPRTSIDHNAYTSSLPGVTMIRWNRAAFGGSDNVSYADLPAFFAGEGHEEHGLQVDHSIFVNASHPPGAGATFVSGQQDIRLAAGAAVIDAGTPVPTLTDGFAGAAPDMGAYEAGTALPIYGPRSSYLDGQEALCDGLDDDGDGAVDEGCDDDRDGYCDASATVLGSPLACAAGTGDCDDFRQDRHPGATELCNGVDDDCDGLVDEDLGVAPEVTGLQVQQNSPTSVSWQDLGAGYRYDLIGGLLGDLQQPGGLAGAPCLINDLTTSSWNDLRPDPAAGTGSYYLTRAQDACRSGGYGVDGAGAPRSAGTSCP